MQANPIIRRPPTAEMLQAVLDALNEAHEPTLATAAASWLAATRAGRRPLPEDRAALAEFVH